MTPTCQSLCFCEPRQVATARSHTIVALFTIATARGPRPPTPTTPLGPRPSCAQPGRRVVLILDGAKPSQASRNPPGGGGRRGRTPSAPARRTRRRASRGAKRPRAAQAPTRRPPTPHGCSRACDSRARRGEAMRQGHKERASEAAGQTARFQSADQIKSTFNQITGRAAHTLRPTRGFSGSRMPQVRPRYRQSPRPPFPRACSPKPCAALPAPRAPAPSRELDTPGPNTRPAAPGVLGTAISLPSRRFTLTIDYGRVTSCLAGGAG